MKANVLVLIAVIALLVFLWDAICAVFVLIAENLFPSDEERDPDEDEEVAYFDEDDFKTLDKEFEAEQNGVKPM